MWHLYLINLIYKMNWKVIKTEKEHKKAVKRAMEIFHAEPGAIEDD